MDNQMTHAEAIGKIAELAEENELLKKIMSEARREAMFVSSGFAGYALRLAPNDKFNDLILGRIKTIEHLLTPNVEVTGRRGFSRRSG